MATCLEIIGIAAILAGCAWCVMGDVELYRTVFPNEAVQAFHLDPDGAWRIRADEIPSGFRRWRKGLALLVKRGLAVEEEDGSLILTESGIQLRSLEDF